MKLPSKGSIGINIKTTAILLPLISSFIVQCGGYQAMGSHSRAKSAQKGSRVRQGTAGMERLVGDADWDWGQVPPYIEDISISDTEDGNNVVNLCDFQYGCKCKYSDSKQQVIVEECTIVTREYFARYYKKSAEESSKTFPSRHFPYNFDESDPSNNMGQQQSYFSGLNASGEFPSASELGIDRELDEWISEYEYDEHDANKKELFKYFVVVTHTVLSDNNIGIVSMLDTDHRNYTLVNFTANLIGIESLGTFLSNHTHLENIDITGHQLSTSVFHDCFNGSEVATVLKVRVNKIDMSSISPSFLQNYPNLETFKFVCFSCSNTFNASFIGLNRLTSVSLFVENTSFPFTICNATGNITHLQLKYNHKGPVEEDETCLDFKHLEVFTIQNTYILPNNVYPAVPKYLPFSLKMLVIQGFSMEINTVVERNKFDDLQSVVIMNALVEFSRRKLYTFPENSLLGDLRSVVFINVQFEFADSIGDIGEAMYDWNSTFRIKLLKMVDCDLHTITVPVLQMMPQLELFSVVRNRISSIANVWGPADNVTNQKDIEAFCSGFRYHNLTTINLSENFLTEIGPYAFCRAPKLKNIYLLGNNISHVSETALLPVMSNSTHQGYELVRAWGTIDISHNKLPFIPESILVNQSVVTLDLSHNDIEIITGTFCALDKYSRCKIKEKMNVSHNRISSIGKNWAYSGNLDGVMFDLSYNKLANLSEVLPLETDDVKSMMMANFPVPKKVNISHNELHNELNVFWLSVFDTVDVSNNHCTKVYYETPALIQSEQLEDLVIFEPLLKELRLAGNNINEVAEATFTHFVRLNYLDLGYNNLSDLPAHMFTSNHSHLQYVNLKNNNLTKLLPKVFESSSSMVNNFNIDLSHNRLKEPLGLSEFLFDVSVSYVNLGYNELKKYPANDIDVFRTTRTKSVFFLVLDGNTISYIKESFCGNLQGVTVSDAFAGSSIGFSLSLRQTGLEYIRYSAFVCSDVIDGSTTGMDVKHVDVQLLLELQENPKLQYLPEVYPLDSPSFTSSVYSINIRNTTIEALPYSFVKVIRPKLFNIDVTNLTHCCKIGFENVDKMVYYRVRETLYPRTMDYSLLLVQDVFSVDFSTALANAMQGAYLIEENTCTLPNEEGAPTKQIALEDMVASFLGSPMYPAYPCSCSMVGNCNNKRFYEGISNGTLTDGGPGSECAFAEYYSSYVTKVTNRYCQCTAGFEGDGYFCTDQLPWDPDDGANDYVILFGTFICAILVYLTTSALGMVLILYRTDTWNECDEGVFVDPLQNGTITHFAYRNDKNGRFIPVLLNKEWDSYKNGSMYPEQHGSNSSSCYPVADSRHVSQEEGYSFMDRIRDSWEETMSDGLNRDSVVFLKSSRMISGQGRDSLSRMRSGFSNKQLNSRPSYDPVGGESYYASESISAGSGRSERYEHRHPNKQSTQTRGGNGTSISDLWPNSGTTHTQLHPEETDEYIYSIT
eukprot:Nk52_evm2s358 gene=Nk52_evmTU2s358